MNIQPKTLLAALTCIVSTASAQDLIVTPGGGSGTYKTIQSAINVARPGQRILVRPGTYAGFNLTKSITILGDAKSPGQVRVQGIAFHPIFPHSGYRVLLSGMTLGAMQGSTLALSGNELGAGELQLDSLIVDGGVFLGVGQKGGFLVTVANCKIVPEKVGAGFAGATVTAAGPDVRIEVSRSEIAGARGTLSPMLLPMAALAVDEGAQLRLAQSRLIGGSGAVGQVGAPALWVRKGTVGAVHASTTLTGGPGGRAAAGGAAIRSDVPIPVGVATLKGGVGTPNGPVLSGRGTILALDRLEPALHLKVDGSNMGPLVVRSGSRVQMQATQSTKPALIVTGDTLSMSDNPALRNLNVGLVGLIVIHGDLDARVPTLPHSVKGLMLYSQAFVLDTKVNMVRASTSVTLRIDS